MVTRFDSSAGVWLTTAHGRSVRRNPRALALVGGAVADPDAPVGRSSVSGKSFLVAQGARRLR
eukprot:3905395-Alexandrium_andersonii.AAC.1